MSAVNVSYHHGDGWAVIDDAAYANPQPDGPVTYCVRRVSLNDGDQLRLRATFDRPLPAGQQLGLTARAEHWLVEQQFAWKVRGQLIVNWPEVEKDLERLAAERREVA